MAVSPTKMSRRITQQSPFLKLLYDCKPRLRKALIQHAERDQIDALSQITLNILRGNVSVSDAHKKKLKRYKEVIRSLASRRVSLARKKQTLLKFHALLTLLIKPVIHLLDES